MTTRIYPRASRPLAIFRAGIILAACFLLFCILAAGSGMEGERGPRMRTETGRDDDVYSPVTVSSKRDYREPGDAVEGGPDNVSNERRVEPAVPFPSPDGFESPAHYGIWTASNSGRPPEGGLSPESRLVLLATRAADREVRRPNKWVVVYPAEGRLTVPCSFAPGLEFPCPVPEGKDQPVGYPITVTFSPGTRVEQATGTLTDDQGKAVDLWVSAPDQPANKGYPTLQEDTICLIPKAPMRSNTKFTVGIIAKVDGQKFSKSWSFTTADEQAECRLASERALTRINSYRRSAGLTPLRLDVLKSRPASAHAAYLVKNRAFQRGMDAADERPELPGYSKEGQKAAAVSISDDGPTPEALVGSLISSIYCRQLLLNPRRQTIGIGSAYYPGGRRWVSVFRLMEEGEDRFPSFFTFPVNGQKDVPLERSPFDVQAEPPLEPTRGRAAGGYAVSVMFPPTAHVEHLTARVLDDSGAELDSSLLGPGRLMFRDEKNGFRNLFCILPRELFLERSTYIVSLKARLDGKAWEHRWSFVTTKGTNPGEDSERAMLDSLNHFRKSAGLRPVVLDAALSRACGSHASYLLQNAYHLEQRPPLTAHEEDPALPGFNLAGQRAGRSSVIAKHQCSPEQAVEAWIDSLYHRIPLLHPNLRRVGCSFFRTCRGNTDHIAVLDARNGLRNEAEP